MTHEQKVIDALQVASAVAAAAEREQLAKEAQDKALLPEIEKAVEACVQHGRVDAEDRVKLAAVLKDPVRAVRFIAKVAAHRNEVEKSAGIGQPVNANGNKPMEKEASARGSDLAFLKTLGLAS